MATQAPTSPPDPLEPSRLRYTARVARSLASEPSEAIEKLKERAAFAREKVVRRGQPHDLLARERGTLLELLDRLRRLAGEAARDPRRIPQPARLEGIGGRCRGLRRHLEREAQRPLAPFEYVPRQRRGRVPRADDEAHDRSEAHRGGRSEEVQARHRGLEARAED